MSNQIFKAIELAGTSAVSIEDAVEKAIAKAHLTVRNIQSFEVIETRGKVVYGKVVYWHVVLKLEFALD